MAVAGLLSAQTIIAGAPAAALQVSADPPRTTPSASAQNQDTVAVTSAPTLASLLARDGYVGIPFQWDADDHLLLDAMVDTTAVTLLLDSGFGGELELAKQVYNHLSGVHVSKVKGSTGTAYGTESGLWGFTDRITLGAIALGPLETYLLPSASLTVSDSVYLLSGDSASPLFPAPAGGTPTLHAVLEQAGQYRIFLDLMREAGLLSLLQNPSPSDTGTDSLAWRGLHLSRGSTTLRALRADRPRLTQVLAAHLIKDTRLDTGCPYPLVLDLQRMGDQALAASASVTFRSAPGLTISMAITPVDLTSVNDILQSQDIPPIDGIVGSRLLRQYGARPDYATGTFSLHQSP